MQYLCSWLRKWSLVGGERAEQEDPLKDGIYGDNRKKTLAFNTHQITLPSISVSEQEG